LSFSASVKKKLDAKFTIVEKSVKLKHVQTKSIHSVQIKVYKNKKLSCFSILKNDATHRSDGKVRMVKNGRTKLKVL